MFVLDALRGVSADTARLLFRAEYGLIEPGAQGLAGGLFGRLVQRRQVGLERFNELISRLVLLVHQAFKLVPLARSRAIWRQNQVSFLVAGDESVSIIAVQRSPDAEVLAPRMNTDLTGE